MSHGSWQVHVSVYIRIPRNEMNRLPRLHNVEKPWHRILSNRVRRLSLGIFLMASGTRNAASGNLLSKRAVRSLVREPAKKLGMTSVLARAVFGGSDIPACSSLHH